MFDDQVFFLSEYFECKQSDIEWILNKVSKNYCLQISRLTEGGGKGFHIRFSCKRSKRYVGFKGLLHILTNHIFFFFFIIYVLHGIFL